jgi:nitroreductase
LLKKIFKIIVTFGKNKTYFIMIDTILKHKSIRKFKNKPIDNKTLEEILIAGTRASTTGNMQVYSMVATTDENLKNQLWEAHFKQDMVKQAPVIITFCADFNRFTKWCDLRNANAGYDNFLSFYTASIDALLAAQNVALAAEDKGLGICYLGTTTYMADKIIKILKLPKLVVPVTTIALGYPDENPPLTDRLPLNGVVHYETYKDYTENDINEIYKEKENNPVYKKFVEESGKENLAQVFAEVRYKKEDNEYFSEKFIEAIKKQDFLK